MQPRVVVAEEIAQAGLALLGAACEVEVAVGLGREALAARLPGAVGLVVRSATRVDARLLAAAPDLRVVGRAGSGVDNIDLEAATRAGVLVVNAPNANAVSTAEHAMALLLAQARRVVEADRSLRAGEWARGRLQGVELAGKALGIVGLGRIGSLVAPRAAGFGMHLLAFDPYVSEDRARLLGVELVESLAALLAQSDFVTLHLPLNPETRGLIGAEALAGAKEGLRLVNTSRGRIVDEEALAAAIRSGRVAGAALDVFADEPLTGGPLLDLTQVVLTPHLAASTAEAKERAGTEVAAAMVDALRGELVPTAVNVDLGQEMPDDWQPLVPVAEALGTAFVALARGLPAELVVEVQGDLAGASCRPLALAALKGALRRVSERPATYVNAPLLAEAHGVRVVERSSTAPAGYPSVLRLHGEVGGEEISVCGAVAGRKGPALVEVLGHEVELPVAERMLLLLQEDVPGVIGRVGTFLGERRVNIANMVIGRPGPGGTAMMGLAVDRRLAEEEIAGLEALAGVRRAWSVDLSG